MPGGKKVVVDAKAPLQAFLDAYDSTQDVDRDRHLAEHARLLRDHVRKLSARSYWAQFPEAPDFVILFLPGEHFYNAALEADPTLIQQGVEQKVLIATPTTLIALLRAVHYGWQQEKVAENAREISELGRELHSRLGTVAGHVNALGKRLGGAVDVTTRRSDRWRRGCWSAPVASPSKAWSARTSRSRCWSRSTACRARRRRRS